MHKTKLTKELLIKTTIEILFRYGFKSATDTFICKEANLTRGALYHHYKNGKIDLLKDVLEYLNENIISQLEIKYNNDFRKILNKGIDNILNNKHETIDIESMAMLELILAIRYDKKIEKELLPLIQKNEEKIWEKYKDTLDYELLRFTSTFFRGYLFDVRITNDLNELNKSLIYLKKLINEK